jgi:hypothetical protein
MEGGCEPFLLFGLVREINFATASRYNLMAHAIPAIAVWKQPAAL